MRRMKLCTRWAAVSALMSLTAPCMAQCPLEWIPEPGAALAGVDAPAKAATTWDPDGAGPLSSLLIVGGSFKSAGSAIVHGIASWDGTDWSPLGTGMSGGASDVRSLIVYNGELVASGNFTSAGGIPAPNIARWNGSAWQPLAGGLPTPANEMAIYDSDLIAVGGTSVYRWNGSAWSTIGSGASSTISTVVSNAGKLYIGGFFTTVDGVPASRVAVWTGSTWLPMGSGMPTSVASLVVYNGSVVAGGGFQTIGGNPVDRVALWNGSAWTQLGAGIPGTVRKLTVHNGSVIAASDVGLRRYDGSSAWPTIVGAIDGPAPNTVAAFTTFAGKLVMGGNFQALITGSSQVRVDSIAQWDGSAWSPLNVTAFDNSIHAITQFGDELVVSGEFTRANGGAAVSRLARWNGSVWQSLGLGTDTSPRALRVHDNQLIAAGDFLTAGGLPANRIAAWNGSAWSPLGSGVTGPADTAINALETFDGTLIVGGRFDTAGGIPAANVAQWNGSSWSPMGAGVSGIVTAIAAYGGDIYVSRVDGNAHRASRWNGAAWSDIGSADNLILSLAADGPFLYAGGAFNGMNSVPATKYIARWDGVSWQPVGGSFSQYDPTIFDMLSFRGKLYVSGRFRFSGSTTVNHIAAWDGLEWSAVGTGLDPLVWIPADTRPAPGLALGIYHSGLEVGGTFKTAGGLPSPYLARWGCTCPADFDASGFADIEDFTAFVLAFEAGIPSADFDESGFVDLEDYDAYIAAFEAGC